MINLAENQTDQAIDVSIVSTTRHFVRRKLKDTINDILDQLIFSEIQFQQCDYSRFLGIEYPEFVLNESLHIRIRDVFKLDDVLFVELVGDLIDEEYRNKKRAWVSGLVCIHRFLLPVSRCFFEVEEDCDEITVAQGIILLRDQLFCQKK